MGKKYSRMNELGQGLKRLQVNVYVHKSIYTLSQVVFVGRHGCAGRVEEPCSPRWVMLSVRFYSGYTGVTLLEFATQQFVLKETSACRSHLQLSRS